MFLRSSPNFTVKKMRKREKKTGADNENKVSYFITENYLRFLPPKGFAPGSFFSHPVKVGTSDASRENQVTFNWEKSYHQRK